MLRIGTVVGMLSTFGFAQDELPRCLDDRLKIELVAEQPDLVTPTGIDVDHLGRVFVIESNTHFPPDGYPGHPTDRVLILENTDDDPQADKVTVFADGLKFTMSVAVEPIWLRSQEPRDKSQEPEKEADPSAAGSRLLTLDSRLAVFLATRSEILLLTDTDGDLKADERERLVHLETAGNYPHNGLAGFAFDALGNMFFGFGENLGADYKIIGSDGTTLSGGGEGGNLYRCKPDGSKLERWATGFWNPHASCFDAFGRLFTVDNDPDSRPPCRLLHIIPGGDYGYRFRNGRKGTHPFTSWNGELPGTLPMVAGTGEAPSGIVCYENDGFPEEYLGTLLVGSWGDHRIDQFVLEPKGRSVTSKAKPIVKGGENFRPVGLAVAPDGSLYLSDWVLKDYKLHGKGRVWRVSGKEFVGEKPVDVAKLATTTDFASLHIHRKSKNLIVRRMAVDRLMQTPIGPFIHDQQSGQISQMKKDQLKGGMLKPTREFFELWSCMIKHRLLNLPDDAAYERETYSLEDRVDIEISSHALPFWVNGRFRLARAEKQTVELFSKKPGASKKSLKKKWGWVEQSAMDALSDKSARQATYDVAWDVEAMAFILAIRQLEPDNLTLHERALSSPNIVYRRLGVQWVGEEKLQDFRPRVEALLADPTTTPDLFLACLATLQLLDGKPASEFEKQPPTQYVAAMVKDATRPAALRATALRMLPPSAPELDAALLSELLSSPDESLRTEAARTLASSQLPEARGVLLSLAQNLRITEQIGLGFA